MEEIFDPVYNAKGEITHYRWNHEAWFNGLTPAERRNHDRMMLVNHLVNDLYKRIPWMNWPILKVVYSFWHGIFETGIKNTIKPRWGLMTFAYLNDGIKPTLWHTWRQITRNDLDKYTGIYTTGAPKSFKQAVEWELEKEAKLWETYKEQMDEGVFV